MLYRVLAGVVPTGFGWAVYSGAIPIASLLMSGGVSHRVPASPSAVDAAISDLSLPEFTGRSIASTTWSGERSLRTAHFTGERRWTLMQGGKEIIVMHARMAPQDGGAATRVTAETEKGRDYDPDSLPAGLRDLNVVRTVFNAALDMELNPLAPPAERLPRVRLEEKRLAAVTQAMTATLIANPMAIAVDARRQEASVRGSMDAAVAEAEARQARYEQERQRILAANPMGTAPRPAMDAAPSLNLQ